MSDLFWASIALLGFAGWAVTLIALMRNLLPMANALAALGKMSGFVDDRIAAQLERAKRVWDAKGLPTAKAPEAPLNLQKFNVTDDMSRLFGEQPIEPFGEQPEPTGGIEVMD